MSVPSLKQPGWRTVVQRLRSGVGSAEFTLAYQAVIGPSLNGAERAMAVGLLC